MKLKDGGNGDFVQAPIGNHLARCIKLIDLGTQEGDYKGTPNFKRQIIVMWELPNETFKDKDDHDRPFVVSKWYTASLSEKANLRADLVNWRGRDFTPEELMGFDSKNILDKPCMVQVTHSDKGKAKVTAVSSIPKGMTVPPRVNDLVYFSLERDEFDQAVFDQLGDYFQAKIKSSPEWQSLHETTSGPIKPGKFDDFADDIPF